MKGKKEYSEGARDRCKALFLIGVSDSDIMKQEFVSGTTLWRWKKEGNWHEERTDIVNVAVTTHIQDAFKDLIDRQLETLDGLKEIKVKSIEKIKAGNEGVTPHKFSEATKGYIEASELERKIKSEAFQMIFLNEAAKVIKDVVYRVVDDEATSREILKQIGQEFLKLVGINYTSA